MGDTSNEQTQSWGGCGHVHLESLLWQQRIWSEKTFGPGRRVEGTVDHIQSELEEIKASPRDVEEWIDVVILAFDGAWRAGYTPDQIVDALVKKCEKNRQRSWPDWRTAPANKAIQHKKRNP